MQVQSALIGAFVTVAVMTGMLLRRRRRKSDVLFAIVCVILALWFLLTLLRGNFGSAPWLRVEIAIAALLPAALIRLFADMMPWSSPRAKKLMNAAYPLSGLTAVASLSPLGNLPAVQLFAAAYIGLTIILASQSMMQAPDVAKGTLEYARRRYLAIGAIVVSSLAILGEFEGVHGAATALGHLAVMLYVFFLAQIILRDRLLDLNEFIGRTAILGVLAILFATISATLIGLGNNDVSRLFNAVVGVIILLILYEPLKDRLETKIVEFFFFERHRFLMAMEDLRTRMQHGILDPARMANIVADTIYDTRRATHVAVYLLDPIGNGFARHSYRGPEPTSRVNANELPALWQAIQQNRTTLTAEQLSETEADSEEAANRDLLDALRAVSADLLFPFVSGEEVMGFLAIRDDRTTEAFSTSEIAAVMKIAETAAIVTWNSKLAERLRERERLAAIGSMAAGLAHEIRNPLGAIKGAAEYLEPENLAADEGEFLKVIIEETNRLNSVVSQFLDYARPFRAHFQPTDLNQVVKKTAQLVSAQQKETPSPLELDLQDSLPVIDADGEQIKQVILNLVLNGIDASREKEEPVSLKTRLLSDRNLVEMRVRDRGCGIPEKDLDQIFIPFFTTKQHGTGLGLAVCQRIIHNHGGTIFPESRLGQGTEFVIRLPLKRKEFASTTGAHQRPAV